MRIYLYIIILTLGSGLFSCEKYLEPLPEDQMYSDEDMLANPAFIEGLLLKAYAALPNDYNFETDIASDDAVTNQIASPYSLMATGAWKASFYPVSKWAYAYEQIFYINLFLEKYDSVKWASDRTLSEENLNRKHQLHLKRLKGEAHGLRAWYYFQLLQYHSGKTADGRLLGFVILNKSLDIQDDWKLPRNSFAECVQAIITDLDTAIVCLPAVYAANPDFIINETSGFKYENRMNGNAARALKSRVALLAASPAFSASGAMTWEQAAIISGEVIEHLGAIDLPGYYFYDFIRRKEIIWNRSQRQINQWERENFPPSHFGNGRTNPSQNLVDAFPMRNGFPIDHELAMFNDSDPYFNRDLRFGRYIIHNGAIFKGVPIDTYVGADLNGINVLRTSTRTGYYLKKFISDRVSLIPGSTTTSPHTYTLFRETEVLLNYAEAANEAWGPDGDPMSFGSARSKIADIRRRAGITQPDLYLSEITDPIDFRELIQNERRIELCFEGFRFWDLRRWNRLEEMTSPVKGVFIYMGADTSYNYADVENRVFTPDMVYGPIPYEETRKYNIEQNKGW